MASPLKFFVDTQNRRLVSSATDSSIAAPPAIFAGNTEIPFEVHTLIPSTGGDPSVPFDYITPSGTCTLAVGYIDASPTSGTFTITDPSGAQTTAAIAVGASASTVQAAVRAGLSTNYSTCIVTGSNPYQLDRVAVGSVSALTINADSALPESYGETLVRRNGTGSLSQIQVVRVLQSPIALADTTTTLTATSSVTAVEQLAGTATSDEVQTFQLPAGSYSGIFTVSSTGLGASNTDSGSSLPIVFGSDAETVQTQINTGWGTGNEVTISKVDNWNYSITYTGTNLTDKNLPLATVDTSALNQPKGWSGTLDLNTTAAVTTLGMDDLLQMGIEIQQTDGSAVTTLWQTGNAVVYNDLINSATAPSGGLSGVTITLLNSKINYLLAGY